MALAGRAEQTAVVLACIGDAAAGRASTALVRGEPGVGKTSLVADACQAADVETLWAGCLPLTSMTAPLLPLRDVLRRAGLGEGVSLTEFDGWLDRAASDQPIVLVVDDLQWADRSSLDVLLYVIAGRADRALAVIATMREAEWLSGWLADVQRLPRVRELVLDRLDRAGTGEQLAGIFGRPANEALEAIDALIELVPRDREPLRLARLTYRRLRQGQGLDAPNVETWRAAVAFTSPYPASVEHALTTAMLADELLTVGDPEGVPLAAEGLQLAERCGDGEAVAEALVVTAYAKLFLRQPGAEQDAASAWEIASRLRLSSPGDP